MFKKLSKKDATKFQFTVSVEDIENFVPPRKEGVSEKKGGFGFGKKKESSSTDNDVSNYSYAVCILVCAIHSQHTNQLVNRYFGREAQSAVVIVNLSRTKPFHQATNWSSMKLSS